MQSQTVIEDMLVTPMADLKKSAVRSALTEALVLMFGGGREDGGRRGRMGSVAQGEQKGGGMRKGRPSHSSSARASAGSCPVQAAPRLLP